MTNTAVFLMVGQTVDWCEVDRHLSASTRYTWVASNVIMFRDAGDAVFFAMKFETFPVKEWAESRGL